MIIFAARKNDKVMTAIEMKYSLFKEIDSIDDESILDKLSSFLKRLVAESSSKPTSQVNKEGIPEFIRNMSVSTGMTGYEDVKGIIHQHWEEKYG